MNKQARDSKLLRYLLIIIVVLSALHLASQVLLKVSGATNNLILVDIVSRFNMDSELSVPTWFSSVLALIAGTLAFLIARNQRVVAGKRVWLTLAVLMVFISLDEVSVLHELVLQAVHIIAGFGIGQTWFANAWLLVLPLIGAGAAAVSYAFYRTLPAQTFRNLMVAFGVFMAGALVIEYLSIPADKGAASYIFFTLSEEVLEMLGLWLVIWSLLAHVSAYEKNLASKLKALTAK